MKCPIASINVPVLHCVIFQPFMRWYRSPVSGFNTKGVRVCNLGRFIFFVKLEI